jgi:hypothetical protein
MRNNTAKASKLVHTTTMVLGLVPDRSTVISAETAANRPNAAGV